jgi:hypothetical protein
VSKKPYWYKGYEPYGGLLIGYGAGKTKRVGRTRARSPRMPGALDGDVERFLQSLRDSADERRRWRARMRDAHGFVFDDVRRVVSIKGRPSAEVAPLRDKIALGFADAIEREKRSTQRGRRAMRQTLAVLYGLDEQQMDRLLKHGRALR